MVASEYVVGDTTTFVEKTKLPHCKTPEPTDKVTPSYQIVDSVAIDPINTLKSLKVDAVMVDFH